MRRSVKVLLAVAALGAAGIGLAGAQVSDQCNYYPQSRVARSTGRARAMSAIRISGRPTGMSNGGLSAAMAFTTKGPATSAAGVIGSSRISITCAAWAARRRDRSGISADRRFREVSLRIRTLNDAPGAA